MILHRALRRPAAALLLVPLMAAAACPAADDSASDDRAPEAGATAPHAASSDTRERDGTPAGSTRGAGGGPGARTAPRSGVDEDGNPTTGNAAAPPVVVDADAIQFPLGGAQLLCWADADDGSEESVFGCQGATAWPATKGSSPASVLLFILDDAHRAGGATGEGKREVMALKANAPVTTWQIQGVKAGGRYRLGDALIDLTDRERLTFTVALGDSGKTASGWVTVAEYGWDE